MVPDGWLFRLLRRFVSAVFSFPVHRQLVSSFCFAIFLMENAIRLNNDVSMSS